ncbi:MAG: amino acid ABC transporter substrate-binding protein [Lachnospiraceae bacterium]|jgi:polar amino acid transport system substrate-binding protein|nr:amino acid ABC transporter substrate-binding protein [Lachnospiraceae bacterium]
MRKRISLVLALALAGVLVLAGCKKTETPKEDAGNNASSQSDGGSEDANANTTVTNDDQTFIVGFDAAFPPYGYVDDNGEYVGFDLDLAAEVCERNGWTLVKQPIDWDSKDMEINSGTIDCIWNGFTINGRENEYTWSEPYVDNRQVIVVAKSSGITDFATLAGKAVEVQADSSALAALREDRKALADTFGTLTEVADYNTAFMDLESGACDAIAMDIGVAYYQMQSRTNPDDFAILDEVISSEQYGVGFKLGNEDLRDTVQATLNDMFEDGTVEEIAAKYESYGIPGALVH